MERKILTKLKSYSGKTSFQEEEEKKKTKKNGDDRNSKSSNSMRFLITINVFGSAGPIRFVVNGEDSVAAVIETALKVYGLEGRLPVLGSDADSYFLYPAFAEYDDVGLNPWEAIGSRGSRNFILCKKKSNPHMSEARLQLIDRKGSRWRALLSKSLTLKILPH